MLFSIARLVRFEKCLLSAFSVFLPAWLYTRDLSLSLGYSLPVLSIVASGFIINDINDVERDNVNNPARVLPQKSLTIDFAVFLYFSLLLIALVIIKFSIPLRHVFVFMLYIVLVTNYNYLVNSFPYLKNLYVVILVGVHLFIIFLLVPFNQFFSACIILNVICQEMLLDLRDLKGDGKTLPKIVGKWTLLRLVVLLQLLQLLLLVMYGKFDCVHFGLIGLVISLQIVGYTYWKQKKYNYTINTLKAQTILMFALII